MGIHDFSVYKVRENASPGYWLAGLLPVAYFTSILHLKSSTVDNFEYKMITLTVFGLCIQSLMMFVFYKLNNLICKILYTVVPGYFTSMAYILFLNQSLVAAFFWGIAVTGFYQFIYGQLLIKLPNTFTFGEAAVTAQGFTLFLLNSMLRIPLYIQKPPNGAFTQFNAIMITALTLLVGFIGLLYVFKFMRNAFIFYPLLILYAGCVSFIPITKEYPILTVLDYITNDARKIILFGYYSALIGITFILIRWQSDSKASTRVRKVFHVLIVLVYIPGLLYYCSFLYLAGGVALAIMILLETIRVSDIPPFSAALKSSFDVFCDEKDSGILAVTPLYLLVGCFLPLWISPCPCTLSDSVENQQLLLLLSGVLTVGVGDTAASIVGSKYGKYKWPKMNKSVEGTLAFILAATLCVGSLYYLNFLAFHSSTRIIQALVAIIITSIVEAFTDQIDNLVLPLIFFVIVRI